MNNSPLARLIDKIMNGSEEDWAPTRRAIIWVSVFAVIFIVAQTMMKLQMHS